MNTNVRDVERELRSLVRDLDPDAVPLCDAPDVWKTYGAIARIALSAQTLLARRVEEAGVWRKKGFRSAEEKMAADAGISISAAKHALETSKQVKELPDTAEAMRRGELSPGKAEAIAGAATIAPEFELALLEGAAQAPLADLRERCLKARAKDVDAAYRRIRRDRYARVFTDGEGAWNLHARGTADDGRRFLNVFEPLVDAQFKAAKAEDREEPIAAYAFDALIELAEQASNTSPDAETSKQPKRTPAKFLGLIRADESALVRGAVEGDETCEIAGLGPIPVRTARELLGDAMLKLVITNGVDVVNVTHLGRSPTMAQRVALWWSARECQRDICTRSEHLEIDHRDDWHHVHETRLGNLDPLCKHEHWLKTNCGWALVEGTGKRPMVPPDDPRHPHYRPPP